MLFLSFFFLKRCTNHHHCVAPVEWIISSNQFTGDSPPWKTSPRLISALQASVVHASPFAALFLSRSPAASTSYFPLRPPRPSPFFSFCSDWRCRPGWGLVSGDRPQFTAGAARGTVHANCTSVSEHFLCADFPRPVGAQVTSRLPHVIQRCHQRTRYNLTCRCSACARHLHSPGKCFSEVLNAIFLSRKKMQLAACDMQKLERSSDICDTSWHTYKLASKKENPSINFTTCHSLCNTFEHCCDRLDIVNICLELQDVWTSSCYITC